MTKNLVDDPTQFPPQTAPVRGETRTSDSMEICFQNAANRSAHVKQRLYANDPDGTGVRRLRSVASLAALRAVTLLPADSVILVRGVGLYTYAADSLAAELEPQVIRPAVIPAEVSGRWLLVNSGLIGVANGLAPLNESGKVAGSRLAISDGAGRVAAANVVNGITQLIASHSDAILLIPADTAWRNIPGALFEVTLALGDLLFVDYEITFSYTPNDRVKIRIQITKPDATTIVSGEAYSFVHGSVPGMERMRRMKHWFVQNVLDVGKYTIALQAASVSGTTLNTAATSDVDTRIMVTRP